MFLGYVINDLPTYLIRYLNNFTVRKYIWRTFCPRDIYQKLRQIKCLFFKIWMIKSTLTYNKKKSYFALGNWQNWCFGQFYHSKIKNETSGLSQFLRYITWFKNQDLKVTIEKMWTYVYSQNTIISFEYVCWFLTKTLSDLVSFHWKLVNPYYHYEYQRIFELFCGL